LNNLCSKTFTFKDYIINNLKNHAEDTASDLEENILQKKNEEPK